ncbi:MAG: hypothetical protein NTX50_31995 [Candidatus Sumerlaeota bacterium]|nr:hypothetical protein [Candidatus Sumerlaeota bacterium]
MALLTGMAMLTACHHASIYERKLAALAALKQSLLHRAFAGGL